jgi:glycosyltransferase involved in cell wall biosynthesis
MRKVAILMNMPAPYRVDLFNELTKNPDYEITVIYSTMIEDNRKWEISKESLKHNYVFLKVKTIKFKYKLHYKYVHIPFNIIKILKELNPDIIIGQEYNPSVCLAFNWAKRNNKRYISWSDGTLNQERDISFVHRYLRKMICSNSEAFIASSTKTKEAQAFYGADERKIFLSILTMDLKKYLSTKDNYNNKNLIFVGRLVKGKGLDLLFHALRDVKNDFILNIIGDGEEEENLKKLAQELNIYDKVNFLGFKQKDEIVKCYKESDIFVFPTRLDCFGLVITEAMCAGLPVIVSKYADGAYDLVDEGKNGFIVDPYDSKELRGKIESLLSNTSIIREMGIKSHERVKKFSVENSAKGFFQAIEYVRGNLGEAEALLNEKGSYNNI